MENIHSTKFLKEKIVKILENNGETYPFKSVTITEPTCLRGEHIGSVSLYAKIQFEDSGKKDRNLFIKKFANSAIHTVMVKKMRLMEKEAMFYQKLLPDLEKFVAKYPGCENFVNCFPKCLAAEDEMIVLENVVLNDGYTMLTNKEQDENSAKHVLEKLSKFHAATAAFIQTHGLDKVRQDWELVFVEAIETEGGAMLRKQYETGIKCNQTILKLHPVEGSEEVGQILAKFEKDGYEQMVKTVSFKPESPPKLPVVNHGDCWTNNMLFKLDSQGNIQDHLFVDLQLNRMGTPNMDVSYFLYTSVKPQCRRKKLKELVQYYYSALSNNLEKFNMKIPLTFDEFFEDYKSQTWYGFLMITAFITMLAGSFKDINLDEMGATPEETAKYYDDVLSNWVKNNPEKSNQCANDIVALVLEQKALNPESF